MLTLYGNDVSSPSNKTRFVANALGLQYEYKPVNLLAGENKTEAFLRLHPAGKVPVLQDGDFVLFESNSIIKYLSEKEGSNLFPKDLRRRALVDQWIEFASLHIGTALARVFVNRAAYKILNIERDERSLQDGLGFLKRFLPVIEAQFKKHAYLAGPEITLADFSLLAHLDQAEISGVDLSEYPHLKKWQQGQQAQDFYQKCFPSYAQMIHAMVAKMGK